MHFDAKTQKREILCKIKLILNESALLDWDLLFDYKEF